MTTFDLADAGSLSIIALYLSATSLSMLLPLAATTKSWLTAWQLTVPISWATQILIAYVCYSTWTLHIYPWLFLLVVTTVNSASVIILAQRGQLRLPKQHPTSLVLVTWTLPLGVLLFSRLYDAIAFVSPGNPDAFAHMGMLQQLAQTGRLANSYYAPGFHLLLFPLTAVVPLFAIVRFSGPIIGILSTLAILVMLWSRLRSLEQQLFALAIFCFPVFNRFLLQTVGFFPSALTFVILSGFLFVFSDAHLTPRVRYAAATLMTLMLAVTVPYLFVQYILAAGAVVIAAFLSKPQSTIAFRKRTSLLLAIALVGLAASAGHVYLQTHVIAKQGGFPDIPTIEYGEQGITTGSNYTATSFHFLDVAFGRYQLYQAFAKPMISTGRELLSVKYPLPLNQPLTLLSIAWINFSAFLVGIALRKRDHLLFTVAVMTVLFGLATITGLFEMSYYRGRSGWYFSELIIMSCIILVAYIPRSVLRQRSLIILASTIVIASIARPIVFPRLAYPELYTLANSLGKQFADQSVYIVTDEANSARVRSNLTSLSLEPASLASTEPGKYFVFIQKRPFPVTRVLGSIIFSAQKDTTLANPSFETDLEATERQKAKTLMDNSYFGGYSLFWENDNIAVYERHP